MKYRIVKFSKPGTPIIPYYHIQKRYWFGWKTLKNNSYHRMPESFKSITDAEDYILHLIVVVDTKWIKEIIKEYNEK